MVIITSPHLSCRFLRLLFIARAFFSFVCILMFTCVRSPGGAGKQFDKICTKSADQVAEDLHCDATKEEVETSRAAPTHRAVDTFT